MYPEPLFLSSGDLIADRRYQHAKDLEARGDLAAAADLLAQTVERAPRFASAWFALGDVRERLGATAEAINAFKQVLVADAEDRQGARLRLARLGCGELAAAMAPSYVRALFDQYAPRFDSALRHGLAYCGPELLRTAVREAVARQSRSFHFAHAIDLGCGTGLMAEALRGACHRISGVDLSPGMIEQARRKGIYDRLVVADMLAFLAEEKSASAALIIAADAFVYLADLAPICREAERVLVPDGWLAFTVETHDGAGVILGEKLRYAHGTDHVGRALASAKLQIHALQPVATRVEGGVPVPGLLVLTGLDGSPPPH